jgi:hypothetical protein
MQGYWSNHPVRIPATVGTSDKPYSLTLEEWLGKPHSEMSVQGIDDRNFAALRALRAVVELHQPEMCFRRADGTIWHEGPGEEVLICERCSGQGWALYPCEELRVIEKVVLCG